MAETTPTNNTATLVNVPQDSEKNFDKHAYFLYTGGRCPDKSITHAKIDPSVSSIERTAFAGCKKLESVQFQDVDNDNNDGRNDTTGTDKMKDNKTPRLTTIEAAAFAGCHRLECMNIPASVNKIGDFAFRDCFQLTKLDFASSVDDNNTGQTTTNNDSSVLEEIGEGAFRRCRLLATIGDLPASVKHMGKEAFYECSSLSGNLHLPPLLEEISPYTFYGCSSLESVRVPETLMHIGVWAFSDCSMLSSINFPDSIKTIGRNAFFCCHSLTKITLPKNLKVVEPSTFFYGGMTSLHLHNGIEIIGDSAFESCRSLSSITIDCRDSYVDVSVEELDPPLIGEVEETEDGESINGLSKSIKSIKKSSIKIIGIGAFLNCESLQNLDVLLGSVEEIGRNAFSGCGGVTRVGLPNSIRKLGDGAFQYCHKLSTASLPESIQVIPSFSFYRCRKLQSIDIPSTVRSIGSHAFEQCFELSEINFCGKSDVKRDLDSRCSNNTTVVSKSRSAALQEIKMSAFCKCTAIKSIHLPDSIEEIGPFAFADCSKLHTVRLGNATTRIHYNAFTRRRQNIPFQEFTFSTPSTLSPILDDEFESTSTMSIEAMGVMKTEKERVVRIRFDQSRPDIIRRIRLYQFVCDLNRGGGLFLQRQQQLQNQAEASQQSMENRNNKDDNGDAFSYQRAYPPSLWPLILSRLFMHLAPPSYKFFAKSFMGRQDTKDLFNEDIISNEDLARRRATVVYRLLVQGIVTDLCAKTE